MAKLIAFAVSLFASLVTLGAAHAVEIADAPPPEPNYVGIIVFLVLFVGGSVLFLWFVMRKKDRNKH